MQCWNGWYHVNGNTYGTWLPGDPRGWRERWHRRHVEGDYKDPPPPGLHEDLHERSKALLTGEAMRLNRRQRQVALEGIVEKLLERGVEALAASVDAISLPHTRQIRRRSRPRTRGAGEEERLFPAPRARAFRHSVGEEVQGASRRRPRPPQLNVYRYILAHANKGACVWTFRDGIIEGDKTHGRDNTHG